MTIADESVTDESTEAEAPEVEETDPETPDQVQVDPDLGAKKAIIEERKARREAEKALADLRAELALKDKPADEQALELARREATTEANARANARIVRAEIRAAAAQRVKNPALAVKLIDTSVIEVDDDGEVDADALASAIDTLLADYPELAAVAPGFGSADQGAKGRAAAPAQLTESDLLTMSPEQINKARREGRLTKLMAKKS